MVATYIRRYILGSDVFAPTMFHPDPLTLGNLKLGLRRIYTHNTTLMSGGFWGTFYFIEVRISRLNETLCSDEMV